MTDRAAVAACPRCGKAVDAADRYCRHCGTSLAAFGTSPLYHPMVILALALTLLGPFALPLVARSRRMSGTAKGALAGVIAAYTVLCLWVAWVAFQVMYRYFSQLGAVGTGL